MCRVKEKTLFVSVEENFTSKVKFLAKSYRSRSDAFEETTGRTPAGRWALAVNRPLKQWEQGACKSGETKRFNLGVHSLTLTPSNKRFL